MQIPEINFKNRKRKDYEFEIISNRVFFKNVKDNEVPFRPHRIFYFGILFTMEGEGFHFIDFKKYPYKKGTVIFLSKEQVHAFERNENREAYLMTFTEKFLEKSSMGSNLMHLLGLFNYHLYSPFLQLDERQYQVLKDMVLHIKREYDSPNDDFTEELIQSSLKIFLFLSERISRANREGQPRHFYQDEFVQFQHLIDKNILQKNQVQFYSGQMGISSKKLNRITQAIMGKSAKNYLKDMLVLEIKRYLVNTSLSVKEISYQTGFDVPTNFVKFFKKNTGMTPVAFRKQY